ncbi:hypothetical protein J6590_052345 [Homalodisca vitripennis]|nr:hypothetical protein J6590_052345 [Homalodisca vitripennis]
MKETHVSQKVARRFELHPNRPMLITGLSSQGINNAVLRHFLRSMQLERRDSVRCAVVHLVDILQARLLRQVQGTVCLHTYTSTESLTAGRSVWEI